MPQQWNQWEVSLKIEPQYGRYWGSLPSTQRINFPPTDTWAFTHLSSVRVYEEHQSGLAFGQVSFTDYDYIEYGVVNRHVDVSQPANTFNKSNFITAYGMVGLTAEWIGRNVGARGLIIIEFWSEPQLPVPMRSMKADASMFVGRGLTVSDFHIVALEEPDTGEIVATHTSSVLLGGKPVSEKEAIDAALVHADKAVSLFKKDDAQQAYLKKRGLELPSVKRLKPRISSDLQLLGSSVRYNEKLGGLEEWSPSEDMLTKTKTSS